MLFEDYHVLLYHNLFIYLLHKACVISYFADDVDHLLTLVSVFTTSMAGIWDSNCIPCFWSFWVFVLTPKICVLIRNPKGVIHRDIKVTNILTTPGWDSQTGQSWKCSVECSWPPSQRSGRFFDQLVSKRLTGTTGTERDGSSLHWSSRGRLGKRCDLVEFAAGFPPRTDIAAAFC